MQPLTKGHYRVRIADTAADVRAAQHLRQRAFHPATRKAEADAAIDEDPFDPLSRHVLIEDLQDGTLVCCFRGLEFQAGSEIHASYSAQFYDLSRLARYPGRMIEIGRFCILPERSDPDILRLAWASLARHVEMQGIEMMFGCSSFVGTDHERYTDTFALLRADHLAPQEWQPGIKASQVFRFAAQLQGPPDRRKAMQKMPPLLRTYLMMGGWVSDHAVIDQAMDTLHVFTGVEIRMIPQTRKKLLLAVWV
ncbi:MAG: GNAT family N-acetyltransferase [Rhodobacterales bacterium]